MTNLLQKTLSPQAARVYSLLLKHARLSAKQIGQKLNIVVNTIYRDLNELIKAGLINQGAGYPIKYQAKPAGEAVALFTALIRQNFYETFDLGNAGDEKFKITFFQTRRDLLKNFEVDSSRAKETINIIASGHEVPAETVLAHKKAVDRGLRVRKLIQHINKESMQIAKSWQKIGVETRYTPLINTRLVIIDQQITHFGSYSPDRQPESVGVRFDYAPFAKLMDEMFEQKWQAAKII